MQVGYLGPLEVRDGERLVVVPGARLQQLLIALALEPGRWVSAGTLADAVWGDELPADPANSLQSLVSRLRRTLGRPELVQQSAAGYRLAIEPDDVDAVRLERLVAESRQLQARGETAAARTVLQEAAGLWRGAPLLDGDSPEAAGRRAALNDLRLEVVLEQAGLLVREGRPAEAVPLLEELTAAAPLREDIAGALIDALAAAGRPAEALAAYERVRTTLADSLGTDPSPALRGRHLELLRDADRPAEVQTNLRAAVTSFVGREDDVAAVQQRLAASRLVTVVGAGGSGKTRLVSEVAARLVDTGTPPLPDGVWLVELASVTEPTAVAQAVLDGLGTRDIVIPDPVGEYQQRRAARQRLLERLRQAECLLVVDNCEHLVDAVAEVVAELLGRCPGVRVLATSREPLAIEGETLYPLGPLAVPAEGIVPAEAAANPAVRLLLDRARAVDPDVVLDDAVVEIVRRLDGLPLAIELAAARLRVYSPAEVAERLADRFRLLTGGRRTATPRHRTLRAVVEWSWDLLTPLEREVAEHFSLFATGATEEAVAAVTPSWIAGTADEELADVLHALVDKSLLTATRTPDGTRFRMLETLREYGGERLAEQGLITAARTAHARWFADLVRAQDQRLRGPEQLDALRVLDTERDDVLAALRFVGDAGDAVAAVDLAVHLGWYWLLRESGQDATRWTSFALAVPGAREAPGGVLAEALQTVLGFAIGTETTDLREAQRELVELAGRLEADSHAGAKVLTPLLLFMGEEREAAGVALERVLGDPDPWVRAAGRLAQLAYAENDGDVDLMRQHGDEAVVEWEALGDRWGLAAMLSTRGQVRTLDGDLLGAAEDYERAQECIRQLGGNYSDDVMVTMRLAELRLRAADPAGAREYLEVLRGQRTFGAGKPLQQIFIAAIEAGIAVAEGDDAGVAGAYEALRELLCTLGTPSLMTAHSGAIGHAIAAELAVKLGRIDRAGEHVREGYAQALLTNDKPILAAVGTAVAAWALARGRARDAAVLHGASTRLRGSDDTTSPSVMQLVTELRAELGEEYEVAYAEGMALDADAATARIDPEAVQAVAVAD
ncbi:BTAD domain-containing putative transcriptional regulator [Petropleomorpha daqingensis]|uniref:Putative ATPase/DNA-binding SARP family transcriptional activator n=1 Tax=Petropleomorpha daqingensis TaxID=2026353 RepID=A0A853CIY7_9ACTN|nr:putative ATPase/DNA-binding SARP family transcriptional activator [Petropleomorpha daqingensis]